MILREVTKRESSMVISFSDPVLPLLCVVVVDVKWRPVANI